ncbi:hypothetical protein KR067_002948 [Drosophila pandora]|nr:hypothetical protein KR067_002948 [Drosophila pandora]
MNARLILKQLPNHLLFRILHYSLISQQLREDLGMGVGAAERLNGGSKGLKGMKGSAARPMEWQPFALWLANLLLSYAGDILGNMLLGTLPLEPLCNASDVLLSSAIWYIIFFCPFDLGHTVASTMSFRLVATAMATISQVQLIERGVHMAGKLYGQAPIPMLIVGTVMGSGAELLKPVACILINRCQHSHLAYIKLTMNSKLALGLSCLFMLQIYQSPLILGLSRHQLLVYTLVLTTTFKFLSLAYRTEHFIWLLEHRMQYTFFGGLSGDLSKFFGRVPKGSVRPTWAFSEFD